MIIKVKVRPGSKEEKLIRISNEMYEVLLKERAENGKANKRLINILSKEFGLHYSRIRIKNPRSRLKIVEIVK